MKNGPCGPFQEEVIYFLVGFFALVGELLAGAAGAADFAAAWASFRVVRCALSALRVAVTLAIFSLSFTMALASFETLTTFFGATLAMAFGALAGAFDGALETIFFAVAI